MTKNKYLRYRIYSNRNIPKQAMFINKIFNSEFDSYYISIFITIFAIAITTERLSINQPFFATKRSTYYLQIEQIIK